LIDRAKLRRYGRKDFIKLVLLLPYPTPLPSADREREFTKHLNELQSIGESRVLENNFSSTASYNLFKIY